MTAIHRNKLRRVLQQSGIDAYIGLTRSNFRYLSGRPSAFLELSDQMTGTDMVIVPANESLGWTLIVNEYSAQDLSAACEGAVVRPYPNWTENRPLAVIGGADTSIVHRPVQFDYSQIFALLRDTLHGYGVLAGRIGTDLVNLRYGTVANLFESVPEAAFCDCTDLLYAIRSIKSEREIAALRSAAMLFDVGVGAVFDSARPGQTTAQMQCVFELAVRASETTVCDRSFFFPHLGTGTSRTLCAGDVIKLDCGACVDGYWSDGCRYGVLEAASPEAERVHAALSTGYAAARAMLRPGAVMRDIFEAGVHAVRAAGLPGYSRGHIGHSIGLDNHQEEPPFIGPCDDILRRGMVLCLELPAYPPDVGGFNIEDMFLITEAGAETLTKAPRHFLRL